ncbi:MAG: threonylcarbamoyl-AMP synthase [Clostridia bacterium]|nr:threonylcarbamoyl-AMP synthase [Clostridia bacterium]
MLIDFKEKIDDINMQTIVSTIKDGGLVVFPTETVYGIGADTFNVQAVKNIFKAKGRASDNPLIAHISNESMLSKLTKNVPDVAKILMSAFWPGPLTIVFDKVDSVPMEVTGGLDTVAVRMPSNIIAKAIIEASNTPLVAPSANVSGKPSGTNIEDIYEELKDKVDIIVDGGATDVGIESTVVKIVDNKVVILRPGKVTKEDIESLGLCCELDSHIFHKVESSEKVASPGMKYKHYAPDAKCVMVEGDNDKKVSKILELAHNETGKVLIICVKENMAKYSGFQTLEMGSMFDYSSIAKNIFSCLRKANTISPDLILLEGVDRSGIGVSIMNRMIRACAYNVINVDDK